MTKGALAMLTYVTVHGNGALQWTGVLSRVYSCLAHIVPVTDHDPDQDRAVTGDQ